MCHQNQDRLFKDHKQLTQLSSKYHKFAKCKNSSSKLNKVHSHEIQISLAHLNYTLSGVQYKKIKIKIKILLYFYLTTKNQKAHIMLNE